jgi:hypothetical protein
MKFPDSFISVARRYVGRLRPLVSSSSRKERRAAHRARLQLECLEDRSCPSTVTLNAIDSGWWDDTGSHDAPNKNYLAGFATDTGHEHRDFFVFDLSTVTAPMVSAQLRVFNPPNGFVSPAPTETYALFDVSTPISDLRASGRGRTDIFTTLGSGVSSGARDVSAADNGQIVTIDFNGAGLASLNLHSGGLFATGGAITTIQGQQDDAVFAFSGFPSDTRQLVLTVLDAAGPVVVASTPSGDVVGQVSSVRVTFDRAIVAASFNTDQVDSFTRTVGTTVTDLSSAITGVTPVAGSGGRQFDVTFTPQTALGNYNLVIGPNILDLYGNSMDQNFNGITGEPGLPPDGDEYAAHFAIQGPKITASTPTGISSLPGTVNNIQVTFNEPVNPATFTPAAVDLIGPGQQRIAITGVTPVAGSGNTRFNISFAPLTTTGHYQLLVLPYIADFSGHLLDQDGNFIGGEFPGDIYAAQFGIAGPRVTASTPTGNSLPGSLTTLQVTFNEAMNPATFTLNQVTVTGPGGSVVPVTAITPIAGSGNTRFAITITPTVVTGTYHLIVGPNIQDTFGNAMDQNGNLIPGEPGVAPAGDQYSATFGVSGLQVQFSFPSTTSGPVSSVEVFFNEPVDVSTFTPDKIASFTGPAGNPIPVLAVLPVSTFSYSQFNIYFAPQTTTGTYTMVVGPNIHDIYGNAMDQNNNLVTGEVPGDQYTLHFNVPGPRVTSASSLGNFLPGLSQVRVTFNEPMNAATFTTDQVQLTNPMGSPIAVTGVTAVPFSNNTQFDIHFDPAVVTGSGYAMIIGPDIQDLYGNSMDQNGNFVPGEPGVAPAGDQFRLTFGILGPRVIASTPTGNAFGPVDHVRVTFNEPMNPDTFTTDQVASFAGPGGDIPVTGVNAVFGSNNTQFDITFAPQSSFGAYRMVIGPNIEDVYGNAMDQDNNLIPGEIPGDQYTAQFTLVSSTIGPDGFGYIATVTPFTGSSIVGQPGTFTILNSGFFTSVPLNLGNDTFNFYGTTYHGNGGSSGMYVSSSGLISFGVADDSLFNTNLTTSPSEPVIAPLWNEWIYSSPGPNVLGKFEDIPGGGRRLIIEWNQVEHIGYSGTLTFQAVLTLDTGGNPGDVIGNYINLQSGDIWAEGNNSTVGIKASGTQGPNRLLVNFTGVSPFVGTGQAIKFTIGTPLVLNVTPSGEASPPLDHVVVTFNTSINAATFSPSRVVFTGPGGPIDVMDVTPVAGSNNTQFNVAFDAQTDLGAYTMVIGPGIMDTVGRSVPQFTAQFHLANNVVVNGDFETGGFDGWTTGGGHPTPVISTTQAHGGTYSAFLGTPNTGSEPFGDSSIQQTIVVPAGHPTLTFWYLPNTTDVGFDWQEAQIRSTSGAVLAQIFRVDSDSQTWTQVTFDLTPFAGQTVVLYFNVHQDGFGDPTGMYVDDVFVV